MKQQPKRYHAEFYEWLLDHYRPVYRGHAHLYWVPIELLEQTKAGLKAGAPNCKFRIVYRGPRYDWMHAFTAKRHAIAFSVYYK